MRRYLKPGLLIGAAIAAYVALMAIFIAATAHGPLDPGPSKQFTPLPNRSAVVTWAPTGRALIDQINDGFDAVTAASNAHDARKLREAFTALRNTILYVQQQPPIPDVQAQSHWAASLAADLRGVDAGLQAVADVNNVDRARLTDSAEQFQWAGAEMELCEQRIEQFR